MTIYQTTDEGLTCPCGAVISEDEHSDLCAKCRSRLRWNRRAAGQQRRQLAKARRNAGRS